MPEDQDSKEYVLERIARAQTIVDSLPSRSDDELCTDLLFALILKMREMNKVSSAGEAALLLARAVPPAVAVVYGSADLLSQETKQ